MSLEVPGSILGITYGDKYSNTLGPLEEYDSYIEFSQFFLRDGNGRGTVRGRYQIRTMQYSILEYSKYRTSITNTDYVVFTTNGSIGPLWLDAARWIDTKVWTEVLATYTRTYRNDPKITVSTNSTKVKILFGHNDEDPYKGFELATVNVEALFHQRSKRI
jgi:hypothetical protein